MTPREFWWLQDAITEDEIPKMNEQDLDEMLKKLGKTEYVNNG